MIFVITKTSLMAVSENKGPNNLSIFYDDKYISSNLKGYKLKGFESV